MAHESSRTTRLIGMARMKRPTASCLDLPVYGPHMLAVHHRSMEGRMRQILSVAAEAMMVILGLLALYQLLAGYL
jgi:hypothetical protein